ncbi:MAG TPA: glutaredoxin family protein [Gaiellaceae bacterium]|nr:glutaredoxin family protein [Gaiellaceae bacterium]
MGSARVVVFHAAGCHLCERALAQVAALQAELGFELETVDISGDPELEARYREWLPVVEIDGERAFVYHVHEDAFRRRVAVTKFLAT